MSNKLEEARKIINEVDSQMAELFVKRMRAAEMVFEKYSIDKFADKILKISPQSPLSPPKESLTSFWSVLANRASVYIYNHRDHMAFGIDFFYQLIVIYTNLVNLHNQSLENGNHIFIMQLGPHNFFF